MKGVINTGVINKDYIGEIAVMITVPTDWQLKAGENIQQL